MSSKWTAGDRVLYIGDDTRIPLMSVGEVRAVVVGEADDTTVFVQWDDDSLNMSRTTRRLGLSEDELVRESRWNEQSFGFWFISRNNALTVNEALFKAWRAVDLLLDLVDGKVTITQEIKEALDSVNLPIYTNADGTIGTL